MSSSQLRHLVIVPPPYLFTKTTHSSHVFIYQDAMLFNNPIQDLMQWYTERPRLSNSKSLRNSLSQQTKWISIDRHQPAHMLKTLSTSSPTSITEKFEPVSFITTWSGRRVRFKIPWGKGGVLWRIGKLCHNYVRKSSVLRHTFWCTG